jgi:peptidoglycan hydrolase-like protein with peptidoglycan-binding domain
MAEQVQIGSKGQTVFLLQRALNEQLGIAATCDGAFGPKTQSNLCLFQSQNGLQATGIFDDPTQSVLMPYIQQRFVTPDDIVQDANQNNIDPAMLYAFSVVEGSRAGFLPDKRPIILFERHRFYKNLAAAKGQAYANSMMASYPDICNTTPGGYSGGALEYARLDKARGIDNDIALMSASWGMFQVMGENYRECGYTSVNAYVNDMIVSEDNQLQAVCVMINNRSSLKQAIDSKNFAQIARLYNGPNYQINQYDTKLQNAYNSYQA